MRTLIFGTLLTAVAMLVACSAGVGGDAAADDQIAPTVGGQESAYLAGETVGLAQANLHLAINAIEHDEMEHARQHLQDAIDLVQNPEQKHTLDGIMGVLQTGDAHTAQHGLLQQAGNLGGEDSPNQQTLHLQLAVAAIRNGQADKVEHHLTHYTEISTGDDLEHGEEALQHALNGDLHKAEDVVNALLSQGRP